MPRGTYKKKSNLKLAQIDETPKEPMVSQQNGNTFASSACQVSDQTDNDALIISWQDEIKKFWCKIKEEAKSSLKLIKQDRIRGSLAFDEIFKENFLRSANSKICSAYEEFLNDEYFFDQCIDNTESEKQDQINQATKSIAVIPESMPKAILTRRQSLRNRKPKQNLSDYYYDYSKRSSTKNSKTTANQSIADVGLKVNGNMSSKNCNDQTSQQHVSISQVESSRMEVDLNTKQKLPIISEESNITQHSTEIASQNMNKDQQNNPSMSSKRSRKARAQKSNSPGNSAKSLSLIILDDCCNMFKTNLPKKRISSNDDSNKPESKRRKCAK